MQLERKSYKKTFKLLKIKLIYTIKLFMTKQIHILMSRLGSTYLENSRYIAYVTLLIMFRILLLSFIV
jgi:hypothetical protein